MSDDDTGLSALFGTDDDSGDEHDESDASGDSGRDQRHTVEVDLDTDGVGVYDLQRHRGGDETAVLLSKLGDGFQALAMDVAADGQVLEVEIIGEAQDDGRAASMCEYWLNQNPKGVLGGEPESSGLLGRLTGGGE